jgi:hypothetical protein
LSVQPYEALVIALWIMFAWVHDIARHSPILAFNSAEHASGKTVALEILSYLTPRPCPSVEITGPALFRYVDQLKPTLLIDEIDTLFARKRDLLHIVNQSWTRNFKIQRTVRVGNELQVQFFSPFCPKALAGLNLNLSRTLASRCIMILLWPALPDSKIDFEVYDDENFALLRRQLARWRDDHSAVLKEAKPVLPAGFANRRAQNWRIMLAIAELAGGEWPQQARRAPSS